MKSKIVSKNIVLGICGAVSVMLAAGIAVLYLHHGHSVAAHEKKNAPPTPQTSAAYIPSPVELSRREALFPAFQKRPFAVARESDDYDWTAEDGLKPEVIRQLAHNELEFERMADESARIFRRQLVYIKETADLLVQASKLSGEPIRQLALPGLDGRQISFEVTSSDLNASGQQGTLTGRIAGQLDSTITLAFKGGREAFTILSPAEKTYLVGEPREPGEVIIKSIDPATYAVGACGNP